MQPAAATASVSARAGRPGAPTTRSPASPAVHATVRATGKAKAEVIKHRHCTDRLRASFASIDEHRSSSAAGWDDDGASVSRRAAVMSSAAAALASVAAGFPGASRAAAATTAAAPPANETFGESLLRRRQVEEGAAQANLNQIMAEIREEEAKLKELRFEREAESMKQINARREEEEGKARQQVLDGKTLCITPFGIDFVGITETLALVGAIGAGLSSNARKAEIAELNEKLRAVNVALRKQVRDTGKMTVYPDGGVAVNRLSDAGVDSPYLPQDSIDDDTAHGKPAGEGASTDTLYANDDFESESVQEMKNALRAGRAALREETAEGFTSANTLFNKALMLGRMMGDQVQVRRAVRGLAASKRGMGDRKGAIAGLLEVLEISKAINNRDGDTDALGTIADMYTEIGDLENAGKYYDQYLDALNDDLSSAMDAE